MPESDGRAGQAGLVTEPGQEGKRSSSGTSRGGNCPCEEVHETPETCLTPKPLITEQLLIALGAVPGELPRKRGLCHPGPDS